ncbi:MAG: TIGR02757 family protein [Kiritimatiellae bacterium]|nr:TIGR02757 family protein [Kiritimatiellia bacterium]
MRRVRKDLLRRLADRYETAAFSDGDPACFLRGAGTGPNAETTAFVAACLSYGSRAQFLPKIRWIRDTAGGDIHGWILSGRFARVFRAGDARSFYRLFSFGRMHEFFSVLRRLLRRHGSLGAFLRDAGATDGPGALRALCGAFAGRAAPVVPKDCTSACKRLCLFLRWMVRDGSPVDAGLWSGWFDKRTLLLPLDVHVLRQARALGLLRCRSASMRAARELTARLAEVFPSDPCRGDFALFGLGLEGGLPPSHGTT